MNSRICALADLGEFMAPVVTDRGHPAEIEIRFVTSFHPGPRSPAMGEGAPALRFGHRRVQAFADAIAVMLFTVTGIANSSLRASMTSLAPPTA